MLTVNMDTSGVDSNEAQEWVNELANVYADMEISDVNVSGIKLLSKQDTLEWTIRNLMTSR